MATTKELMETIESLRQALDGVYTERNLVLALAANLADRHGHKSGLAKDKNADVGREWENIVYIDVPSSDSQTMQLSWHIHESELTLFQRLNAYTDAWDGHSTEEKYERIKRYARD